MMEIIELSAAITPVFGDLKEIIQIYAFCAIFQNSLINRKYKKQHLF